MLRLMLATSNPGKVAELRAILASLFDLGGVTLLTPRDWPTPLSEVDETGTTFAENARLKADALAAATGLPALADDSGLCVDALDGAPGLYSARWAGAGASDADRNAKLLLALADVPPERRTARFACAAALAMPGGETRTAEGVCEGVILNAPRGANGFGYDPLFLLPDLRRTMAELTSEEKNRLSHRALAVSRLSSQFSALMNPP
jgi:non-canonical purine NTP pyrophosphatase (RdgB/HAM1 family)